MFITCIWQKRWKTKNTHETAWVSSFCSTHKEWSISSVLAPYLLRPRTEFGLVCPSFLGVALVGPSWGAGDTSRIFYSPGKSAKQMFDLYKLHWDGQWSIAIIYYHNDNDSYDAIAAVYCWAYPLIDRAFTLTYGEQPSKLFRNCPTFSTDQLRTSLETFSAHWQDVPSYFDTLPLLTCVCFEFNREECSLCQAPYSSWWRRYAWLLKGFSTLHFGMSKMLLVWSLGRLTDRSKTDSPDDADGRFPALFDESDGVVLAVVKDDDGNDVIMCGNRVRSNTAGEATFGDVTDFDFAVWGRTAAAAARDWRWWLCSAKAGNM